MTSPKPITNFRKLGTGRKRREVVVINEEQRIVFIAKVCHNYNSRQEIVFDNQKTFYMDSQTLGGRKVSLFFPTERLEDSWQKQCEVDAIEEWMKIASSQDIFAFLECVGLERGVVTPSYHHNFWAEVAKSEIRRHLDFLGLVQLRRLGSLLGDVSCGSGDQKPDRSESGRAKTSEEASSACLSTTVP